MCKLTYRFHPCGHATYAFHTPTTPHCSRSSPCPLPPEPHAADKYVVKGDLFLYRCPDCMRGVSLKGQDPYLKSLPGLRYVLVNQLAELTVRLRNAAVGVGVIGREEAVEAVGRSKGLDGYRRRALTRAREALGVFERLVEVYEGVRETRASRDEMEVWVAGVCRAMDGLGRLVRGLEGRGKVGKRRGRRGEKRGVDVAPRTGDSGNVPPYAGEMADAAAVRAEGSPYAAGAAAQVDRANQEVPYRMEYPLEYPFHWQLPDPRYWKQMALVQQTMSNLHMGYNQAFQPVFEAGAMTGVPYSGPYGVPLTFDVGGGEQAEGNEEAEGTAEGPEAQWKEVHDTQLNDVEDMVKTFTKGLARDDWACDYCGPVCLCEGLPD